jgi:hypothetical protein
VLLSVIRNRLRLRVCGGIVPGRAYLRAIRGPQVLQRGGAALAMYVVHMPRFALRHAIMRRLCVVPSYLPGLIRGGISRDS